MVHNTRLTNQYSLDESRLLIKITKHKIQAIQQKIQNSQLQWVGLSEIKY